MFIKYSLVLIICTLLFAGFIGNNMVSAECTCGGSGSTSAGSNNANGNSAGNGNGGNDPSIIHDPIVKIYGHWDFEGELFVYNQTDGYIQLPDNFRKNVQSFQSGIDVCFMSWNPKQQVQIKAGEYHKNYAALTNFGQYMDALYAGSCSDAICPLSNK